MARLRWWSTCGQPARARRRYGGRVVIATVALLGVAAAPAAAGYEQVTPVDKGGTEPAASQANRVSEDGGTVHFSALYSLSSLRPESGPWIPSYVARRGETNWSSMAVDPPIFPIENAWSAVQTLVAAVSRDGSRAIVVSPRVLAVGASEGALNVYRRDLKTGSYVWIGSDDGPYALPSAVSAPSMLPFSVLGGSANFDRVWVSMPYDVRLAPEADSGTTNLYEWSAASGLELVSRQPNGSPFDFANGPLDGFQAQNPNPVSTDGRQIVMLGDGYLYMRRDGVTKPVAYSRVAGESDASVPLAYENNLATTPDGRFIAFVTNSSEPLTDDAAGGNGLYIFDRDQPESDQLTYVGGPGALPGSAFFAPQLLAFSDDGQTAYFMFGGALYVWRGGAVRQIAAGSGWGSEGHSNLSLREASLAYDVAFQASPTGRFFAFPSVASLTGAPMRNAACTSVNDPGLDGYCPELFVYDANSESTVCASCATDGSPSRGPVGMGSIFRGTWGNEYRARPTVFDSGRVLFDTPNALVTGDANAARDVYAYADGARSLISRAAPGTSANFMTATEDGASAFFVTDDPIVAQDTDALRDIYLARNGAGLPEQNQRRVAVDPCSGSDCRASAASTSADGGSATQRQDVPRALRAPRPLTVRASLSARVVNRTRIRVTVNLGRVGSGATVRVTGNRVRGTSRTVRTDGRSVVSVPLTNRARRILRQRGKLAIGLSVRATPAFGSSKTVRVKKTVRSGR